MKKSNRTGKGAGMKAIFAVLAVGIIAIGPVGMAAYISDISFCQTGQTKSNLNSEGAHALTRSFNSTINETIIFSDDFEDGNYDGWTAEWATIENGSFTTGNFIVRLHAENGADGSLVYDAVNDWVNFTSESTFEIGDSFNSWADVEIVFYNSNTILFDVKSDTISLNYNNGSGRTIISSVPYDVRVGVPYTVKIVTVLQQVDVYVNGIKVLSNNITGWGINNDGIFGFNAHTSDPGWFNLDIDNVVITKTEVSDVVPVVGNVLFEDNFEDGNYDGWNTRHTYMQNSSLGAGNFMIAMYYYPNYYGDPSDYDNGSAAVTSGLGWSDYQYELSLEIIRGEVQMAFYSQSTSLGGFPVPHYSLILDPESNSVYLPGNSTSYPLNYNTQYDIKITVSNGEMSAFINGNLIATGHGSYFTDGTVGILAYDYGSNATELICYVDNVKVTQLEASRPSTLSVTTDNEQYYTGEMVTLTVAYTGTNTTNCQLKVTYPDGGALITESVTVPAKGESSVSFNLPTDALSGVYAVHAETYNNEAQTAFTVVTSILTIESKNITFSKPNPAIDENIWIYAIVHNEGTLLENGIVSFYDNDKVIGTDYVWDISSGETKATKCEWRPSAGGEHIISVSVYGILGLGKDKATRAITVGSGTASVLVLSTGDINIYRFEPGEERTISVDVTCYQTYVHNVRLVCLDNQNLTVDTSITPPRTMNDGETIVLYLKIKAPQQQSGSATEYDILLQAIGDEAYSNAESLDVVITNNALSFLGLVTVGSGALAVGLGAAGLAASRNESWKYWLFSFLLAPLYVKLKKDKVLDHFVRGQIFGHIKTNPGAHYNEIKDVLGVANGVLAHHLRTLEREEFIKSRKDGKLKRFYPADMNVEIDKHGLRLSEAQLEIIDAIRQNPGVSQSDIARAINKDRRAVGYHIKQLNRMSVIRLEREGRETKCYIEETDTQSPMGQE